MVERVGQGRLRPGLGLRGLGTPGTHLGGKEGSFPLGIQSRLGSVQCPARSSMCGLVGTGCVSCVALPACPLPYPLTGLPVLCPCLIPCVPPPHPVGQAAPRPYCPPARPTCSYPSPTARYYPACGACPGTCVARADCLPRLPLTHLPFTPPLPPAPLLPTQACPLWTLPSPTPGAGPVTLCGPSPKPHCCCPSPVPGSQTLPTHPWTFPPLPSTLQTPTPVAMPSPFPFPLPQSPRSPLGPRCTVDPLPVPTLHIPLPTPTPLCSWDKVVTACP